MNNNMEEQIFDGGIHKSVEQPTPTPTPKPIQWKVGDIFAPSTVAPEGESAYSPIAILHYGAWSDPAKDIGYVMVSPNIRKKLCVRFINEIYTAEDVTEILTIHNARKIGELTWNILVEDKPKQ